MTFFADLAPYTYLHDQEEPGVVCVGWLGSDQPFNKGETTELFRTALAELCNNRSINHCWGYHICEFCPKPIEVEEVVRFGNEDHRVLRVYDEDHTKGNGEIRIRNAKGIWFVAPALIIHYVESHNYLPPKEFIEAVLDPYEVGVQKHEEGGEGEIIW